MWSEFLPVVKDYGPFALFALMVVLGWLIPRVTHRQMLADKDKQIERQDALITKLTEQNGELMELARTTVAAWQSLPRAKEPL